jgi:hypothetical protein
MVVGVRGEKHIVKGIAIRVARSCKALAATSSKITAPSIYNQISNNLIYFVLLYRDFYHSLDLHII